MSDYGTQLDDAVIAWSSGRGETDTWARSALTSLLQGKHTPMTLSQTVYARMKPKNARGKLVSPKIIRGNLSVRNLENTSVPVPGAAAARKNLEAVLLLFERRDSFDNELEAFAAGRMDLKLYGLVKLFCGGC